MPALFVMPRGLSHRRQRRYASLGHAVSELATESRMSDILIGVIVFALIFGGALFGMFLGSVLPTQHLSTEARDVIRVTTAMLATLSAVVLGLLTGSAISSLAEKEGE